MPTEFHNLEIAGIVQETPDARSFFLAVPETLRSTFRYRAGQFLTFEVSWNGMQLRRCYSLSSAPEIDPWLKFTVKRVDDGRISNWFIDRLSLGDPIRIQPPEGRFVLRSHEGGHGIVLFGGGSGITPLVSILKSALRTTTRNVKLVYANRNAASVIFRDEIDLWSADYPDRLEVSHHLDSESGFMTAADAQKHIEGWEDAEFFVCGPSGFMDTVEEALRGSNIDPEQTKFERFISPIDPDREHGTDEPPGERDEGEVPETFTMRLEGESVEVRYQRGLTLLECAVQAGHKPPSSCEDGYCGCCMALLRNGRVDMLAHDALEPSDIERGWVLACQARPASAEPVEIDFDAEY